MKKLLLLLALAACKDDAPATPKPLDDLGEVPAFTLQDQTGGVTTEAWLAGRVTIANFVFTRCDTICPMLSLKMARLAAETQESVQLVSFSVDPAYDTPPVLAEYASRYGADAQRWRFLTGDYDEVKTMVEGALMTAMEPAGTTASGAPDIRHGGHFLLVGPDRHIRGVYDSSDDARMKQLARDARQLALP